VPWGKGPTATWHWQAGLLRHEPDCPEQQPVVSMYEPSYAGPEKR
jgi:hypothetical protein